MSAVSEAFSLGEIFISSIIIFVVYFLFFTRKKFVDGNRKIIFGFSVILLILFQHIVFEIAKYFFDFQFVIPYRFAWNVLMVPLFFYFLFFVKKNKSVNRKIWKWVLVGYSFSVFFVGLTWFFDFDFLFILKTFFQILTSFSLFLLIIEFLSKK